MTTARLNISGMSCDHCVQAVKSALENVPGVLNAAVDLDNGRATIRFEPDRTNTRALANAVMDEGYMAEEAPD